MSLFDLLFLALVLTAVATVVAAGWAALTGRLDRAARLIRRLLLAAAVYMAVVVAVSLVLPRRVLAPGADECFDDWCIGVASFRRSATESGIQYEVNLRLHSRARRVSQRERNLHVYLTDARGGRYEPVPEPSAAPFDVLLSPGESALVTRRFMVPAGSQHAALALTHQGGFPIGWFIIGYDSWFRKPRIVRLD